MFCKNCGNNVPNTAAFCGKCGTAVNTANNPIAQTEPHIPQNAYTAKLPRTPFVLMIIGTLFAFFWLAGFWEGRAEHPSEFIGIMEYTFVPPLALGSVVTGIIAAFYYKRKILLVCFRYLLAATILFPASVLSLFYVVYESFQVGMRTYARTYGDRLTNADMHFSGSAFSDWAIMIFFVLLFATPHIISCVLVKKKL